MLRLIVKYTIFIKKVRINVEQTNTPLIEQLQQTLLTLDAELAQYIKQDERLAARLVQMHNSSLASTQDTLDRLLNEVFNKTQLLTSQRGQARFMAHHAQMTQGGDTTSHVYAGSLIRLRKEEDELQWNDVPLQTTLPLQQEMGNLTLSITGLQTSSDTLRLLCRLDSTSIREQFTEENATSYLSPSFTGVIITDDLGTEYVIGQIESMRSTSRYDTETQHSEQTSENVMTLAPILPPDARKLHITIQNLVSAPFTHGLFVGETVKVVEGPWTFEFVVARV